SVYTNLSVPITWLITGQAPDSMQLSFTSSTKAVGNGIPTGGMLYIDDVNMNFSATGLETFNTATFNVFPNPANNKITIQASAELGIITIYNCLGETVMQTKSLNNKEQVDISKFSAGIYTIQTQNRFIKLIKQ
ncbi:MAG TPA: T9SS type A sorting domain-containing protein, partial [Bacteroidia bacterium]|nr:T9SS type A sorting domain-containing protein [Bacteroidia bacterium]